MDLKAMVYFDRFRGPGDVGVNNATMSSIMPIFLFFGLFILRPHGDGYGLCFDQGSG